MLQYVAQSDSRTNRADLCRPPLPPVHTIYLWSLESSYLFFDIILIAGRMSIGQLTLLTLFLFVLWQSHCVRFVFDYVQHDVSKLVSNNIVCTNYERRSWTSAFFVLYLDFCLRQVRCRIKKPVYHRIPVLPRYPIGIFTFSWVKMQNVDGNDILILGALICYVFL